MQRAIVEAPDLSGAALLQLKQWLGITRDNEDAQLIGLLQAALDMCEAFTGQFALEVEVEEALPPSGAWQRLASRPVTAILAADLVGRDGSRTTLASGSYEVDIDTQGVGCFRSRPLNDAQSIRVRARAGVAADWLSLPDALKHGIIRLAAHHYRDRDMTESLSPPASITALWRPWRLMRIA